MWDGKARSDGEAGNLCRCRCAMTVCNDGPRLDVIGAALVLPIRGRVCRSRCRDHHRLGGDQRLGRDEGGICFLLLRWGTLHSLRERLLSWMVRSAHRACSAGNPLVPRNALGRRPLQDGLSRDRIGEGGEGRTLLTRHLRLGLLNLWAGLPRSNAVTLSWGADKVRNGSRATFGWNWAIAAWNGDLGVLLLTSSAAHLLRRHLLL